MKTNYLRVRLLLFALISFQFLFSQSAPITIDGIFDDWTPGLETFVDTSESIGGIDFLEVQVTNDSEFLFIKIKANTEFDLTDNQILHELGIFIDADNNSSTGFDIQQGYGSELGILFTELFAHYNVTPYSQVGFTDLKLRAAPTVTSDEFEIAIGRHVIPDGTNPLFSSSTIKILLKNDDNFDKIPDVGGVFSYTFDETPVTPYIPIDLNKSEASHIRILAYNTLLDGLLDSNRVDDFENIITVLNPDIVGFIESAGTSEYYECLKKSHVSISINEITKRFINDDIPKEKRTTKFTSILSQQEHNVLKIIRKNYKDLKSILITTKENQLYAIETTKTKKTKAENKLIQYFKKGDYKSVRVVAVNGKTTYIEETQKYKLQ